MTEHNKIGAVFVGIGNDLIRRIALLKAADYTQTLVDFRDIFQSLDL